MSVQPSLPSWKVEVLFVAPQFRIVVKCFLRTQKTAMNSVSPYYVNLTLFYSYFVCYCLQWVDTSSIQQFLDLTSPDFLSYPLNLTLDLHCNFVLRMEIRWWQTKLDVKTIIFKHLWAIDLHDQRPSTSSACIKPLTGYVTISGSLSRSIIQQVRKDLKKVSVWLQFLCRQDFFVMCNVCGEFIP